MTDQQQPIPFQKRSTLALSPIITRGVVMLNPATNQIEIEYWRSFRFVPFFRFPSTLMKIPVNSVTGVEMKCRWFPVIRQRLRLFGTNTSVFRRIGIGALDLNFPAEFREAARAFTLELNFRTALASVN
ncbi:hypothetical protein N8813_00895 [bacterium]|nr:hypothetical protein [bacterium]